MSDAFLCGYTLNGDGSGTPVEEDRLRRLGAETPPVWIHLSAHAPAAIQWLEDDASLPDDTLIQALLAEDTRPRLLSRDGGVLLILRGVNLNQNAEPEDMVSIRIWAEPQRLISVQLRDLRGVAEMRQHLESGSGPIDIGDLIATFVEGSIARMSPVMRGLADSIDEMEDRTLSAQLHGLREEIVSMRRKTVIFNRFLAPQQDILQRLSQTELAPLDPNQRSRLLEAHNDIARFVEDLQALRERSHAVQDEIANMLSERLNRNTYVFSIIAAIFIPLSFLTGLLGINVPGIPGADDPKAFLIFCGILVAVVLAQIAVFKKLHWF